MYSSLTIYSKVIDDRITLHLNSSKVNISNLMSFLFQGLANGYITFVVSILFIGACTAIIGDIAGHLGCFINLKDGVNAIAFVALGTSVPGSKMSSMLLVLKLC